MYVIEQLMMLAARICVCLHGGWGGRSDSLVVLKAAKVAMVPFLAAPDCVRFAIWSCCNEALV